MTDSIKKAIQESRKREAEATEGPWEGFGNFPFYVEIKKPAPSLSKHDNERPTYWRYEDGVFVLCSRVWEPRFREALAMAVEVLDTNAENEEPNNQFEQVLADIARILEGK